MMERGTADDAGKALDAAAASVMFVIVGQVVVGFLTVLTTFDSPSGAGFSLALFAIVFGVPTLIYGILRAALNNEKMWALIALLALVSLHALLHLAICVAIFSNRFNGMVLVTLGIAISMLVCIVRLARLLAVFSRLRSRGTVGFQVVLPIDNDREK